MNDLLLKLLETDGIRAATIGSGDLPELSSEKSETKFGEVFYALLQTNERFREFETAFPPRPLGGTYVGIGFGTSLYLVHRHFADSDQPILLCEREPYVYLLGKIFLRLLQQCESAQELFLCLLDHESFVSVFSGVLSQENAGSPVFIRRSKEELCTTIPEQILKLRYALFSTRHHKLTATERTLFSAESSHSIAEKTRWVGHFLKYKADSVKRLLVNHFSSLQQILSPQRTVCLCVDFFHPGLWEELRKQDSLWKNEGMIYFSNAAIYSAGENIRKDEFSTSRPYSPALLDGIAGANEHRHQFVYSVRREQYDLCTSSTIPTTDDLLESFRSKSSKALALEIHVTPAKKKIDLTPPPKPATSAPFRIVGSGNRRRSSFKRA